VSRALKWLVGVVAALFTAPHSQPAQVIAPQLVLAES